MRQLTLFDMPDIKKKETYNMTWLELYTFLHKKANDIHNLDSKLWNSNVHIHDAVTGEEYNCDTFYVDDNTGEKLVLMINIEEV
jgi:hypothetical protein